MFLTYIFNNKVIDLNDNVRNFIYKNYGLKSSFLNFIVLRLECDDNLVLNSLNKDDLDFFLDTIYKIVPTDYDIFSKKILNIWLIDNINSYRGWRHFLGLPVRGQRTWSNKNSVFKSNSTLRDFKLMLAKKFYGNIPSKQINIGLASEQINYLWRNQWTLEWISAKNSMLRQISKSNPIKIDLFSMYNLQIMHPFKLKKLSKKQKQSFKKNYFSLGFDTGFSRSLLRSFNKLEDNESSPYGNASIVLRDEKKKKTTTIKKQPISKKNVTVKKKKTVWDF